MKNSTTASAQDFRDWIDTQIEEMYAGDFDTVDYWFDLFTNSLKNEIIRHTK